MDEINEEPTPNDANPIGPEAVDEVADAVDADLGDTDADDAGFDDTEAVDGTEPIDDTVEQEIPLPPAPPVTTPQYDRLTRDPFATFGGVLSGIAHRYGWDVALTRLAFVVLLIVSGGTALVAYFLAWLIIPRASYWPPARVAGGSRSRLSGRDLGIGLVGLGALVVLGIGSGRAGAVLVPLAMVGGGIWLLVQNPRESEAPTPAISGSAEPSVSDAPMYPPTSPIAPPVPMVAAQPVPKRSRMRRVGLVGLFGAIGLLLLTIIALPILLIAVFAGGDIEFSGGDKTVYRPASIEEIETSIVSDAGEIELDLRSVDFDSITSGDDPVDIDIDLDFGSIVVRLPDDVRVVVEADADLGDVTVFGSNDDGINPSLSVGQEDPQVELDLNLNVGEIVVTRGGSSTVTVIEVN